MKQANVEAAHGWNRFLPALARLPFGVYVLLGVLSFFLCILGGVLFIVTAVGRIYDAFQIAEDAVAIRGVNGLAADSVGNLYVGTAGSSSIQVFDGEGRFLYRLCVPTYKAVEGSFHWTMDGSDRLTIYTVRPSYQRVCWDIRSRRVTESAAFETREAYEEVLRAEGLRPEANCPGESVRDGTVYRASSGGRVRAWPEGHPEDAAVCELEVPHWPPPIPVCWGMAVLGFLGTGAFFVTAVKVEEYRRRSL